MASPSPSDLKGKRLGRYTLTEHLASGGMAEIYLAQHQSVGGFSKELVLKTLQSRYAQDQGVVDMFLEEARLAARLNHPNIVDVYDVGEERGLYYIAMEYLPGKTLTEVVRRGIEVAYPLPLQYAVHMVGQAAEGLHHMQRGQDSAGHPFEIVHRDISPSNLIVGLSGHTKIIDFGIARAGSSVKEEAGTRPGKVSYMSPEQVRALPVDGRSDIFSLGIILYEITVGRRLWRGPPEVVMKRVVEETPVPPTFVRRDYPAALELVVMRALEKRPEDRYQSADELFRDLDAFQAQAGIRMADHELAAYLREIFAPHTQTTETGMRRARAFENEEQELAEDELDELNFDRARPVRAGAALADALRASGPLLPVTLPPAVPAPPAGHPPGLPLQPVGATPPSSSLLLPGRRGASAYWALGLAFAALAGVVWFFFVH